MPCGASSIARFFVSACRPACAAEYALVGVVSIASTAHIEPTLRIAPPPAPPRLPAAAAHRPPGAPLRHPERRAQDRAERLLEVLLGLLEERDGPEDAGAVDEDVDRAEALDGEGDEVARVLARRDRTGA